MPSVIRHARHQGPVVAALGRTVAGALGRRLGLGGGGAPPEVPGPESLEVVPPRPPDLVADYVRWAGGDPAAYAGTLPPHLFPQWGMPLLGRTLAGLSLPVARALNAGCRIARVADVPANEPLQLAARLERIDDDGRRAILHQALSTRTLGGVEVLHSEVQALIPLRRGDGKGARPRLPPDAERVADVERGRRAGLEYACLTGDFNPLHWVPPYARAAGFDGMPLHGFATLALAYEALVRHRLDGDWRRLAEVRVRFTRPLLLPARTAVWIRGDRLWVADGPGEVPYLAGRYALAD